MAVVKPQIVQISGFQNSGKTTVAAGLIKKWTNQGKKVATIKHHGHGGKPKAIPGKDSSVHLESGAAAAIVEGEGSLIMQASQAGDWSLNDQIEMLAFFRPDIILIEGHKFAPYAKVVIIHDAGDMKLLNVLENIIAVVYWDEILPLMNFRDDSYFSISDKNLIPKLALHLEKVHKKDEKN